MPRSFCPTHFAPPSKLGMRTFRGASVVPETGEAHCSPAIAPRPEAIPMQKRVAIDMSSLINHLQPQTFPATAHHIHQYLHLAQHLGASTQPLAPQLKRTGDVPAFSATKQPRPYVGLIAGAEYGQPSVGPPSILSRPLPN